MYHAKDGWIIIVKGIDSILYYLLNNKVISLYRFGELIAFLERDKFFGFLHKLITDLWREIELTIHRLRLLKVIRCFRTAGRLGFPWDTVIQPFDFQIFIHSAIFELFGSRDKVYCHIWYAIGMIDGNLGNVSTGVLTWKVANQRKRW